MAANWQWPLGRDLVDRGDELHIDLHPMARVLYLVPLRVLGAALVALVGPQPADAGPSAPKRWRPRRRGSA